ncbi:hypothetical protein [Saprospira grandis]|uniref:Uncharacterized protein n=1 Tax=Saprospira grandis (strain Lewin) TaxID=984262 RepID=H6L7J5_SAPGL|nr:hypothetical protein [Saprospira grandis]AFC23027.1 hypothetical protein SGRA_0288 [Saprospira grandis str. Lewin]
MIKQEQIFKIFCNEISGTAFVHESIANEGYIYVVTCKHCLVGKDFSEDLPSEIILESYDGKKTKLSPKNILLYSSEKGGGEKDIAICLLEKKNINFDFGLLDLIKWCSSKVASLFETIETKGYPAAFKDSKNSSIDYVELKYIDVGAENILCRRLTSSSPSDSGHVDQSGRLSQGFSGSPCFIAIKEENALVGCFSIFEDFERVGIVPITLVNQLLIDNGLNAEPIWSLDHLFFIEEGMKKNLIFRSLSAWSNFNIIAYEDNSLLKELRDKILQTLAENRYPRVVGLSGLGKTRLVFESLKARIDTPKDNIVYFDVEGDSYNAPKAQNLMVLVAEATKNNLDITLVLDNCEPDLHKKIAETIRGGSIKLLTINNEAVKSDIDPEVCTPIEMKPEINEGILKEILRSNLQKHNLPEDIIRKYIDCADNFPLMGLKIIESCNRDEGEVNREVLIDNEVQRKIIFGNDKENKEELKVLQAIALFDKVLYVSRSIEEFLPVNEIEELEKVGVYIAEELCGVTYDSFQKTCDKYLKKGLLEAKGRYIYLKPLPLALKLAVRWWRDARNAKVKSRFLEFQKIKDLGLQAAQRLEDLSNLKNSKLLVKELWGPGCPFSKAEFLNTYMGSRLFRSICVVNPEVAVEALWDNYRNYTIDQLLEIQEGRRNLVWALEKLCYRKTSFPKAAKLMLMFAVAENERIGNNATGQFKSLFKVFLAGTETPLANRLAIINWGIEKSQDFRKICLEACSSALETIRFTRMLGAEKQGSKILVDHKPSIEEINDYWASILEILKIEIDKKEEPYSAIALDIVEHRVLYLLVPYFLPMPYPPERIKKYILDLYSFNNGNWLSMYEEIQRVSTFKDIPSESRIVIDDLLVELAPQTFELMLVNTVVRPTWRGRVLDEKNNKVSENEILIDELIDEIEKKNIDLSPYIDLLFVGEQRYTYYFASKLAKTKIYAGDNNFLKKIIDKFIEIEDESKNPIFWLNFIRNQNDIDFKRSAYYSVLKNDKINIYASNLLPWLLPPCKEDVSALLEVVRKNPSLVDSLEALTYARFLSKLNKDDVKWLIYEIDSLGDKGNKLAIQFLGTLCYNNSENWGYYKEDLLKLLMKSDYLLTVDGPQDLSRMNFIDNSIKLLEESSQLAFALKLTKDILVVCSGQSIGQEDDLRMLLKVLLKEYFNDVWPLLADSLLGKDFRQKFNIKNLLHKTSIFYCDSFLFDDRSNYAEILNWCTKNQPKAPLIIVGILPIFQKDNSVTWHEFTMSIIDEFGTQEGVLEALAARMETFSSSGSMVPLMEDRKKISAKLLDHRIPEVQEWAKGRVEYYEKRIKEEQIRDEERNLRR